MSDHYLKILYQKFIKQECIPVGCVPAARRPYAGVCFWGGVCLVWGGVRLGGCLPGWGVSAWSRGTVVSSPGGLPGLGGGGVWSGGGGVWSRGVVSAWSGGWSLIWGVVSDLGRYPSMHWGRPFPPVNRMTYRCKNITLATTSLRPVNILVIRCEPCSVRFDNILCR